MSDAVRVVLGEVKEEIRNLLDDKLREFQSQYRTCATCDAMHSGVNERIVKLEKMNFWLTTAAITGTLGALLALGLLVVQMLAKQ